MKKPNKKVEAHRQKTALKKAERKKARKQICQERLNHKQNVITAKKQEIFDKWVSMVNTHFEENVKK